MSKERDVLLLLKGAISEASPAEQAKINSAADKLRAVVAEYGDEGTVALALVGSEMAAAE